MGLGVFRGGRKELHCCPPLPLAFVSGIRPSFGSAGSQLGMMDPPLLNDAKMSNIYLYMVDMVGMVQGEPESGVPVPYTSRYWMTCACPVGVLFLIIFGISLLTRDLNYLSKNLLKPLVELSDEVETWSNASDPVI